MSLATSSPCEWNDVILVNKRMLQCLLSRHCTLSTHTDSKNKGTLLVVLAAPRSHKKPGVSIYIDTVRDGIHAYRLFILICLFFYFLFLPFSFLFFPFFFLLVFYSSSLFKTFIYSFPIHLLSFFFL
jgi:hypothetical protein